MADVDLKALSIGAVIFVILAMAVGSIFTMTTYTGTAVDQDINNTITRGGQVQVIFSNYNNSYNNLSKPSLSQDQDGSFNDNKNSIFFSRSANGVNDLSFNQLSYFKQSISNLLGQIGTPNYLIVGIGALIALVLVFAFISYMTGVK